MTYLPLSLFLPVKRISKIWSYKPVLLYGAACYSNHTAYHLCVMPRAELGWAKECLGRLPYARHSDIRARARRVRKEGRRQTICSKWRSRQGELVDLYFNFINFIIIYLGKDRREKMARFAAVVLPLAVLVATEVLADSFSTGTHLRHPSSRIGAFPPPSKPRYVQQMSVAFFTSMITFHTQHPSYK